MLYHNDHSYFITRQKKSRAHLINGFIIYPTISCFGPKFWACCVRHFLGTAQFTTQGQATHAKDNLGLDDFKAVQALHLPIHKEFTTKFSKLPHFAREFFSTWISLSILFWRSRSQASDRDTVEEKNTESQSSTLHHKRAVGILRNKVDTELSLGTGWLMRTWISSWRAEK